MFAYEKNSIFIQKSKKNWSKIPIAVQMNFTSTVNSRYLEVVGIIFYKFKLPEVQINLHFG